MRDCFVAALLEYARRDPRIMLVTGDLGFGVLDKFSSQLPRQYLNAGVAEQNMTGVAAGMALEGRTVFTYSIANFPTLRCLEQIRNDVCYHDANVKVVAIGGGFSYGALGMSHHATEDVAILRALPGISVYAPCDEIETRALTELMVTEKGPAYLRLDKSKVGILEGADAFTPGRLRRLRRGARVAIITYGGIAAEALTAAGALASEGVDCALFSAHTLKPFDTEGLLAIAREYEVLVTVEEHVRTGGIGSLVADVLIDAGVYPRTFRRVALPDQYCAIVGSQEYLRAQLGLNAASIAASVRLLLDVQ